MPHVDVGETRPSLLGDVADWADDRAWGDFRRQYAPLVEACSRALGLAGDEAAEMQQEAWITIARRMTTFVYDPGGSFRGWLWRVAWRQGLDFRSRRGAGRWLALDGRDEMAAWRAEDGAAREEEADDPAEFRRLHRMAARIQAAVRRRVQPKTWEAFWLLAVLGWDMDDVVRETGLPHASAYKAKERVLAALREEARRDPEASAAAGGRR
ncbi:Sigma-70 region 2 [Aquisphaera giovannonii]|uniref:Sigma-70 region 2 n=1 Tax=Aquisphaera giovannonii TaxID=406548 RepID=A0A5B9VVF4_9BACT|nr:sigma-70 family RNA polymerase sigma factor [Aquisphaera giovannonii]QEH31690.1 Sigma-70 region 2 [Aquisphaera giovannonii]